MSTPTPDRALPPDAPAPPDPIEASIIALTTAAGPLKSISPSDVAQALHNAAQHNGMLHSGALHNGAWQSLLTPVRTAAARLAEAGRIEVLRKGRPATGAVRGVIRLRIVAPDSAVCSAADPV